MQESANAVAVSAAALVASRDVAEHMPAPHFHYLVECRDADGNLKWTEEFDNVVTTVGKNDLLDKYFAGSAYTATWYMGLKGVGSAVAGDTMASHAGWAEITAYSNANRPTISWNAASGGSKSSTTTTFNINGTATVAGCFVGNNNTIGGTSGILYSAGDFTGGNKSVQNGDTLNVTVSLSI